MPYFICTACGAQFAESAEPPPNCLVCEDARQYIPESGQGWTTLDVLRRTRRNSYFRYEPNLIGIGTDPSFAIGQRALLVQTSSGNVLWDCITLLDDATIDVISALGGIRAIAISHPHYYASMVEWSRAFGAPVHVHADDREWVMRPDPAIRFWDGEQLPLADGLTLVRCGGHFPGGAVLHWRDGAGARGALLTGDVVQVSPSRTSVSFMYSYPNFIPLPAHAVERIASALAPLAFDRLYGAWWDRRIVRDAKDVVARSTGRYIQIVRDAEH